LPTTPEADPEVQRPLWARFEREGLGGLERDLYALSPDDAGRAQRNPRRVIRALEIWQRSGRSPADFPPATPRYRYSKRRLELSPGALEKAVSGRTEQMFAAGLVGEVQRLLRRYPGATTALQAIGYKEVQDALSGNTVAAAQHAVTQATLRYAKRQRTWFQKEPGMQPLRAAEAAAWLAQLTEARQTRDL